MTTYILPKKDDLSTLTLARLVKLAAYYEKAGKRYESVVKNIKQEIERRTK